MFGELTGSGKYGGGFAATERRFRERERGVIFWEN